MAMGMWDAGHGWMDDVDSDDDLEIVIARPATKQEKTVVDYAKLHQIKLNKNYGEARIWADISHLSQKKLRAESLLNHDDEGRQFTDKQCKVLWQKLVESWRKINDYITNKRTGAQQDIGKTVMSLDAKGKAHHSLSDVPAFLHRSLGCSPGCMKTDGVPVQQLAQEVAAAATVVAAAGPGEAKTAAINAFTTSAQQLLNAAGRLHAVEPVSRAESAALHVEPTQVARSNVRVTLPVIKKWSSKDLLEGRDFNMFVTDIRRYASALNQELTETLLLHTTDDLRKVVGVKVSQAHSQGKALTADAVIAYMKELIGYHLHDTKHTAMNRLVQGLVKQQPGQAVLEYAVAFRLEALKAAEVPQPILCDMFVRGLTPDLRHKCARDSDGLVWTDLNACIQYAAGKEAGMASTTKPVVAVAPEAQHNAVAALPKWNRGDRSSGRGGLSQRAFAARNAQGMSVSDDGRHIQNVDGSWREVGAQLRLSMSQLRTMQGVSGVRASTGTTRTQHRRPWGVAEGVVVSLQDQRQAGGCHQAEAGAVDTRVRRYTLREMNEMKKQVAELLAKKLIEPSCSPYGAPVLFVEKRDGTLRMCVDYRALNKLTVRDRYPLPRIDDLFDKLQGKTIFSSLDLQSVYHQIRITPEDVPKTAFVTPEGQFQYKVLSFGLTNAPATFQRVMNRVFEKQLKEGFVLVYLDDILVMSSSPEEHAMHLKEVLQVMKDNQLYAKLSKCDFNRPELKFLGHIVGRQGIAVDPAKVQVIKEWPVPTSLKELQAFLGLANFFRRFIAGYSTIAAPLTHLTGEKVAAGTNWQQLGEPALRAFNALKQALCSTPVLALPDPNQPFEVWSDASLVGTGGVLLQGGRVVAYTGHKFSPAQMKYTTGEQELLGIIRALQEWRCYLDGAVHVTIVTDHNPLIYLKAQTNLSRRQARWMEFLARFNHHIEYKPGKGNVADPLSRNPALTYQMTSTGSDDDDGEPIMVSVGAALCVSGVYALVLTRRQAGLLQQQSTGQPPPAAPCPPAVTRRHRRPCADGRAVIPNPVAPCDEWPGGGETQLDSATHTPAASTEYSTTTGDSLIEAIIKGYSTDERFADRAYTQAYELSEAGLWMSGGKVVVPKSPLVRRQVLESCHDANYAGHMGISKTWHGVNRYFTWPGMRKDVEDYVRQCDACQRNKPSTRLKAGKLQPLSIPGRRWESISMDMIVKLPKSGKQNYDSIMVYVDRLSKMVHLVPTHEAISAADAARLFYREVVRLHGLPASVVSDRGPIFNSQYWRHVCELCHTQLCMSSAYHPETDGQTERANRIIEEMLRHYVDENHSDWADHLPWVEFAINNSWHETVRNSPFFLNYGQHPLTPAVMDLPRKVPKAAEFVEGIEKAVRKAKHCWRVAQQRMKALVDGKRLLRMIGKVAVQLHLPPSWNRMHNVFHVSLVKPYWGNQTPNLAAPPPVQWLKGEPVYEVEKLLAHRVVKLKGRNRGKSRPKSKEAKKGLEFLVRWAGYSEEHDTWEPQKNLLNCEEAMQAYIEQHGALQEL
ncbi:hypothetical protein QJQ45_002896 [Haematococcus lacustris]|nr:hypothetical protein QJQ45_002896 [Haematococcus lacustris]